ncbi:hypothetical protein KUCAC02_023477, partial [Chaenocephalus aceratus]
CQRAAAAAEAIAYDEADAESVKLSREPIIEGERFCAVQRISEYVQAQSQYTCSGTHHTQSATAGDYLRYRWYEDNYITKHVVEYRMKVHVFGNSPSPAVAIYCMRQAAKKGEKEHGMDVRQYVERQFYVDDGLPSVATPEEAIDLLKRTQEMLAESIL